MYDYKFDPHPEGRAWSETPRGGFVTHTEPGIWKARPFDQLGTDSVKAFSSEGAAWFYAEHGVEG